VEGAHLDTARFKVGVAESDGRELGGAHGGLSVSTVIVLLTAILSSTSKRGANLRSRQGARTGWSTSPQ
jgi:hypothetical protein